MELTVISADQMTASRWSGGTTTEIAIAPQGAVYGERTFAWRVSSASVELEQSAFTPLPAYHRIISTIRGEVTLTHDGGTPVHLAPYEVHHFDGGARTDCVGTSLRHGCKRVVQLEIMPRPAAQRAASNPWPEWPKTLLVDYGQEEAIAVQGQDPRHYQIMTQKIEGDKDGNVKALHTVKVEWVKDASGRISPKPLVGTEKVYEADLVLLAMGFVGPEAEVLATLPLEQDQRGNFKAQYNQFATSVEGVFACGDARRGQSLVVWAIDEGRRAAREVDKFLMGESFLP